MKRVVLVLTRVTASVAAGSASADPVVSRSIAENELRAAIAALPDHLEELAGIAARAATPKLGFENGDVRIQVLRPTPLVARLGLADGDVVTSINDLDLHVGRQALELYRKLMSGNAALPEHPPERQTSTSG